MHLFLNDSMIPEEKASIHIKDRGFLLGDGLFETLKVPAVTHESLKTA